MISEDSLAVAMMAKIAGSELVHIDTTTIENKGSGPANRLNPKAFLVSSGNGVPIQKQQEQELIRRLQAEAEALYPLPVDPINTPNGGQQPSPIVTAAGVDLIPQLPPLNGGVQQITTEAIDNNQMELFTWKATTQAGSRELGELTLKKLDRIERLLEDILKYVSEDKKD